MFIGNPLKCRRSCKGAIVFFVASFGMALSPTLGWLIVWRVIEGITVGVASMAGLLLIAETAPPDIRGALRFLQQPIRRKGVMAGVEAHIPHYGGPPSPPRVRYLPSRSGGRVPQ